MNSTLIRTDEAIVTVPASPLEKSERQRVMEAGKRRITGVEKKIFMCGQCFAVEIPEGKGVCPKCDEILTLRERERFDIATARYALLCALALLAFTVAVASWILATPISR